VIFLGIVAGSARLMRELAFGQTEEKEKTVTKTESEWQRLVQERIAQALAKDKAQPVSDKQILLADNWHTAIYKGVEYTVYTGPGQVMATRLVPPKTQPKSGDGKLQKPATSKAPAK
jgi:hypothetical protein